MRYIYFVFFIVSLISFIGFSQTYWWELKQSGSSLGGPVDYLVTNPDVVYYGSDFVVYKSVDRGESFSQTGTNVPGASEIKCIILDDYNAGTFLVAIESSPNDKIYKTTNDGQNWELTLNEGHMSYFGIPMTQDPTHPDTIYTMTSTNFKRSTDFGSTWTTIANNFGPSSAPCDIEVFPDTSIILIGDNGTGIYRSLDYGLTWSLVYATSGEIPTVSVDFTNPGIAWATKWSGGGGLLKSTDYGENWVPHSTFTGINMWGVHLQPTDGNIILVNSYSTSPGSWRTIDAGLTWTPISIPSTGYQVISVDSMTQFAAQGNGFYKLDSDNFNQNVVNPSAFSATSLSDTTISLEFTTNGSSENVVITWNLTGSFTTPVGPPPSVGQPFANGTLLYNGTDSPQVHSGLNGETVYYYKAFSYNSSYYSSGLESSDTTFASQTTVALTVVVGDGWNLVSAPGINPDGMAVGVWWPNLTGTVFSFDGVQYQPQTDATPGVGYWMKNTVDETYNYPAIEIVAHDPIPVTVGWNIIGGYETSPTIVALKAANSQITGTVFGFDGVQYVPATNLVPGNGYWVEVTTDDDLIYPTVLSKGSGEVVELFKEDWGRIILTDALGKSYTLYAVVGEVDLSQYNMPPLPPAGSFDIRFSSGRIAEDINSTLQSIDLVGVTYPLTVRAEGMDMRLMDETGKTVNVNLKSGEEVVVSDATIQKLMVTGELVPAEYALEQNYPNPFNPSTVIEFSLPEDVSNVRLSIYNALGEKVAELVNGSLAAGKYQYQWNAQNVATGMYIYELRTSSFVSTKKMLLLK